MVIAMYVNDLPLNRGNKFAMKGMEENLSERFERKDLDETKHCLGLEVSRSRKQQKLWLSHARYAKDFFIHFQMLDCRSVNTSMEESGWWKARKLTKINLTLDQHKFHTENPSLVRCV